MKYLVFLPLAGMCLFPVLFLVKILYDKNRVYICKKCGHKFNALDSLWRIIYGTPKRLVKCPKCNEWTNADKVKE